MLGTVSAKCPVDEDAAKYLSEFSAHGRVHLTDIAPRRNFLLTSGKLVKLTTIQLNSPRERRELWFVDAVLPRKGKFTLVSFIEVPGSTVSAAA